MSIDYDTAVQDMYATFALARQTFAALIPVQYRGTPLKQPLPANKAFLRIAVTSVDQAQRTVTAQFNGARRFEAIGFVTIEMFTPITEAGDGEQRRLATLLKNAFCGRSISGKVQFSRPRIRDLPEDGIFYRRNVVADYEYDEII